VSGEGMAESVASGMLSQPGMTTTRIAIRHNHGILWFVNDF
jgi:hypothetical protein